MDWGGVDNCVLSAVWTLILMAPIHCKESIGDVKCIQICSDKKRHTHIYILHGQRWEINVYLANKEHQLGLLN